MVFANLSPRLTRAQSSNLAPRISQLEAEIFQLRSQINRLQSQLDQTRDQPSPQIPRSTAPAPTRSPKPEQQVLPSQQMFDNLATLVIELKERIQVLEKQPCRCESQ